MSSQRIVLAGGGSAGHVNPLLATANELRERGYEITVLGTAEGLESELVPAAGFDLVEVPKVPFPRRPSKDHLSLVPRLRQAVKIARETIGGAQAVIGFGGYVSTPAYRAARQLGVPFVIHEQNVRPGLANRVGARHAAAVALTFPSTKLAGRRGKTETTGLPLREAIAEIDLSDPDLKAAAREKLGLEPGMSTLLVTGGSLGAQHLNEVLVKTLGDLPANTQVLHLTGHGKDGPVREAIANQPNGDRWHVRDYLPEMEVALAAADLVVCRSGAGTVAELTSLGLPAIYVPLPIGNGEQRLNAADVVSAGGAHMVLDEDFSADTVRALVYPILLDEDERRRMSKAASKSAVGNGTARLADLVEEVIGLEEVAR